MGACAVSVNARSNTTVGIQGTSNINSGFNFNATVDTPKVNVQVEVPKPTLEVNIGGSKLFYYFRYQK
jgi:hypothetical protein